jgi:TonB family protein
MKVAYKLAALLSLGSLITLFASAKTESETYLQNCRKDTSKPVPISVVSPQISAGFANQTVNVEFTVDASGTPTALVVKSSPDEQLSEAVVEAVKQWKFIPAHRAGEAVAARVALPVHIVAKDTFSSYAAN